MTNTMTHKHEIIKEKKMITTVLIGVNIKLIGSPHHVTTFNTVLVSFYVKVLRGLVILVRYFKR